MSEPELSIKWDKKSKKVGKLLERLAEVVELEAQKRSEERLDEVWMEGYETALSEVQKFGLARLVKGERDGDA
jgi:hypothetical protein